MEKVSFSRNDQQGRPVEVEFWLNDEKITMIRRIYYYNEQKLRSDFPSDSDNFEQVLKTETDFLKSIIAILEMKETEPRASYTANFLQRRKK